MSKQNPQESNSPEFRRSMEKIGRSAGLCCQIRGMSNNSPDTCSIAWVAHTMDGWVGSIGHAPTPTLTNAPAPAPAPAPASASVRLAGLRAPQPVPPVSNSGIGGQSHVPRGGGIPSTTLWGGLPKPTRMRARFSCGCSGNYGSGGDRVQHDCRRFFGGLDHPLIDCRVFFGGNVPPGGTLNIGPPGGMLNVGPPGGTLNNGPSGGT
jgi:hypothetical protein